MEYGGHFGHVMDHALACMVTIMAFRGGGGDPDRGERQRLQEYEDRVDQDYDPFHEKCGKNVFFSNNKIIATTKEDLVVNGGVFSAKPIPLGGMFQVKLLEGTGGVYTLVEEGSIVHWK